jgi:hypothetical protein
MKAKRSPAKKKTAKKAVRRSKPKAKPVAPAPAPVESSPSPGMGFGSFGGMSPFGSSTSGNEDNKN